MGEKITSLKYKNTGHDILCNSPNISPSFSVHSAVINSVFQSQVSSLLMDGFVSRPPDFPLYLFPALRLCLNIQKMIERKLKEKK